MRKSRVVGPRRDPGLSSNYILWIYNYEVVGLGPSSSPRETNESAGAASSKHGPRYVPTSRVYQREKCGTRFAKVCTRNTKITWFFWPRLLSTLAKRINTADWWVVADEGDTRGIACATLFVFSSSFSCFWCCGAKAPGSAHVVGAFSSEGWRITKRILMSYVSFGILPRIAVVAALFPLFFSSVATSL